jgi:hypothetical protein
VPPPPPPPAALQELTSLARRLDTNADGTLDYYEFAKLIELDPSELCVHAPQALRVLPGHPPATTPRLAVRAQMWGGL